MVWLGLVLGTGAALSQAPPPIRQGPSHLASRTARCSNGIVIENRALRYQGKTYRSATTRYTCDRAGIDRLSGLRFISNEVGNAIEPVDIFYFDAAGLVIHGELQPLTVTPTAYWFRETVMSVPGIELLYSVNRNTRTVTPWPTYLPERPGCAAAEFIGTVETHLLNSSTVETSRVDECGAYVIHLPFPPPVQSAR